MLKKQIRNKKYLILPFLLFLLIIPISYTVSYLIYHNFYINQFEKGTTDIEILETVDNINKTKQDVKIKNIGNCNVFVRVVTKIYWKNELNEIIYEIPKENLDYQIKLNLSDNWLLSSDGYYYYKNALAPNETTENLINNFVDVSDFGDNRSLVVDIVAESIQSTPSKAVIEAWNVSIQNNHIIKN